MAPTSARDATEAVLAQFGGGAPPRLAEVVACIVRHLHEAVRETRPTEEEWLAAIGFLVAVGGRVSDERRNEMIMLSDTRGVSALVDALNYERLARGATESTVLGPFFVEGAAARAHGDTVVDLARGEPTVVVGRDLDQARGRSPGPRSTSGRRTGTASTTCSGARATAPGRGSPRPRTAGSGSAPSSR
jgi:Catechol dioxygenase N terminus